MPGGRRNVGQRTSDSAAVLGRVSRSRKRHRPAGRVAKRSVRVDQCVVEGEGLCGCGRWAWMMSLAAFFGPGSSS